MNTRDRLGFYLSIAGLSFCSFFSGIHAGKEEIAASLLLAGLATVCLIMTILSYLRR